MTFWCTLRHARSIGKSLDWFWIVSGRISSIFAPTNASSSHPVSFYSKLLNAVKRNYEIHDKELLAVVRCLEEWDAELRSVKSFRVITDHKNLEYFIKPKLLSERQVR